MLFKVLLGVDAAIAAVTVAFLVIGLGDGSVSSENAGIWLAGLATLALALGGGYALHAAGMGGLGNALLLLLAVPGVLVGLGFAVLVLGKASWR